MVSGHTWHVTCHVRPLTKKVKAKVKATISCNVSAARNVIFCVLVSELITQEQLECGPMPNVMVALPNIGGVLCSTPQSLADAHD